MDLDAVSAAIAEATGKSFIVEDQARTSGGCISDTRTLTGRDERRFFLKTLPRAEEAVLAAEADGLRALHATATIRVPVVVAAGTTGDRAFLVLEHLTLRRSGDAAAMGRQLAALHRQSAAAFGWARDNFIGAAPQRNGWEADWPTFFRERRLRVQFEQVVAQGTRLRGVQRLLDAVPAFFESHTPPPSLLHGDLWGGNAAFDEAGQPVVFDPAVYYGDREVDLAMTQLFGGFEAAFYRAYDASWPLDSGHRRRLALYNLYHVLNHENLFGGYAGQAQRLIDQLTDNP